MIRMPAKCSPLVLSALLLGALSLALPRLACADSPNAPAPATLEQQITVLEGALSEGLVAQDWKMIEIAVKGFASSGLKDKDLELVLLRAERNAALDGMRKMGGLNPAQIETLGLAVRAKLGDSASHTQLHAWGFDEIPEVAMPDPSLWQKQPAEADKQLKLAQAYQQDLTRREYALLALALLKEPGVLDRSIAVLQSSSKDSAGVIHMGTIGDTLVVAALTADADAGLKKLLAICSDEKESVPAQVKVLQSLVQLRALAESKTMGPDATYSSRGDVATALPKGLLSELLKPYAAIIQRWKPDEKQKFDMSLNNLINLTYSFPKGTLDKDTLAAIQATKDRIPEQQNWMKQQVDQVLRTNGVDPNAAQKPPAPPKDF